LLASIGTGRDLFSRGDDEDLQPSDPHGLPQEFQEFQQYMDLLQNDVEGREKKWDEHFHVFVTVKDRALLVVAYGVRNALLQLGIILTFSPACCLNLLLKPQHFYS